MGYSAALDSSQAWEVLALGSEKRAAISRDCSSDCPPQGLGLANTSWAAGIARANPTAPCQSQWLQDPSHNLPDSSVQGFSIFMGHINPLGVPLQCGL